MRIKLGGRRSIQYARITVALLLSVACAHGANAQDPPPLAVSAADSVVTLTRPTEIRVVAVPGRPLAAQLKSAADKQVHLVLSQVTAEDAPGITYNIYLNLPSGAKPQGAKDPRYAGTFSFFHAVEGRPTDIALNITALLQRLLARNEIGDDLRVMIVPAGEPNVKVAPRIAQVLLTAR